MGVIPDDNNQTVRAVLVTLRPNEVGAVLTVLEYEGLK